MPRPGWRAFVRGIRALVNPARADAEVGDELQHFLDESAAEARTRGLSAVEARRAVRAAWGDTTAMREGVRASGWEHAVATIAGDVRHGSRRLRRAPGFTLVAVGTLAIGIGASTAVFSALSPLLFTRLPYPDAGRVAVLLENDRSGAGTFAMYRTLAAQAHAFEALAVIRRWQPAIAGADTPERLDGQRVSAGYFTVLGVRPAIGRDFTADDDRAGAPPVVVVSDALWRRRLGADPAMVGTTVRLDDTAYTVIGVMPEAFENVLAPAAQAWTPLQYDPELPPNGREWGHHLTTIVRVARGFTLEAAGRDANAIGRAMLADVRPDSYDRATTLAIEPLQRTLVRGVQPVLLAIGGAVLLVLIITCVNVTNLVLARAAERRGEFALRSALGGGAARLARQVLTESLLLAAMAGAAGVAFAVAAVRGLVAIAPAGLPRANAIVVDGRVMAFAIVLTTLVALVFGLLPARDAARLGRHREMHAVSRRSAGGHGRMRGVLVVVEVALAVVLLVGAGLLLRSVRSLLAVPPGFQTSGLLTMQVQLAGHRFDEAPADDAFLTRALDEIRRVPGVIAAGASSQLPLSGDRDEYGVHFPADGRAAETFSVFRYAVSAGYFSAAGIPILRGRAIDEHDTPRAPAAAVISASLAARRFGSADPIGRPLAIGPAGPFTIVGVSGDVRQLSLAAADADAVYINAAQSWFPERSMSFVVRAHADPAALTPAVRAAIWAVDKDQPIVRVATMETLVAATAAERAFALTVFEGFALAALALAAIGIYGILAGAVGERTREIGLRSALGATRGQIVGLVAGRGLALAGAGAAIGLAGAAAVTPALSTLLFAVSPLDPITYVTVCGLLAAVAAAACAMPAWRAVNVDPSVTLRAE